MRLTDQEKAMLEGREGPVVAEAIDYLIQLGEAFQAERLVDIVYCHYPAEMGIYAGQVEELVEYAKRGGRVRVPSTSTTLCADLEKPWITGIPKKLADIQAQVEGAHRSMGVMETYTCTPQQLGFIPPFGSYIACTESSAIIYYNSVIGARTNRGGEFTRFAAITGKYPLMGYLLDENRKGTHHFKVNIPASRLQTTDAWAALGFVVGTIVGSEVPVIEGVRPDRQDWLVSLGAALATSGSVTLFHVPGVTPEARTVEEAFHGKIPKDHYEVTEKDLDAVYAKLTTAKSGSRRGFRQSRLPPLHAGTSAGPGRHAAGKEDRPRRPFLGLHEPYDTQTGGVFGIRQNHRRQRRRGRRGHLSGGKPHEKVHLPRIRIGSSERQGHGRGQHQDGPLRR